MRKRTGSCIMMDGAEGGDRSDSSARCRNRLHVAWQARSIYGLTPDGWTRGTTCMYRVC